MASVSADPPMLLVCIHRRSALVAAILANRVFGVSVLGEHQAALADTFAGRPEAGEPFDFGSGRWQAASGGVPLLLGAAARFDCEVASTTNAGSHAVVIGDVRAADQGAARPLAYTDREYARPVPLPLRAVELRRTA